MSRGRFAQVALPVGADIAFTYRVPSHMADDVVPGLRVLVPFGRRKLAGVVVTLSDESDLEEASLRDIAATLESRPALSRPLLDLAQFLSDYYIAPIGEAVRTVHPGGAVNVTRVRLTAEGARVLEEGGVRGSKQRAVLERLLGSGIVIDTTLGALAGANAGAVLRELETRGWIERGEHLVEEGHRTVTTFQLAEGETFLSPAARQGSVGALVRQVLAEATGGMSMAELGERLGREAASLRGPMATLEKRGAVVRGTRIIERAPAHLEGSERDAAGAERALSGQQQTALGMAIAMVDAARFDVMLLEGVTGSGKTEVYFRAFAEVLARGRTGIYLVPEIAITPLLMRLVRARFGARTAILHSGLSDGERHDERARITAGQVDVVLGARSAVFAPLPRLGLIVVDEEHEPSYKQDSQPRYHGRDVAVMRGRLENVPVLLGSATPSLESYRNAMAGRYRLARMPERAGDSQPATVELVDMRAEYRATREMVPLSRRLREALAATLAAGRQAMILLNRRGWADFVLCRECGEPEKCEHCAVTMTVHLKSQSLLCHYCDARRDIPEACRNCGGTFLQNVGAGTEQLETLLGQMLPDVAIGRLDRDVTRRKGEAGRVLSDFDAGRTRVLLGTQMIAKGHDFAGVTLVGVLQADRALWLPDFRAAERTFQLLTQVAGRAGRRTEPGRVVVQTFSPEHPAIALASTQDFRRFYDAEAPAREALGYPPFSRLIGLLVSGTDRDEATQTASLLGTALRERVSSSDRVLGPAAAPLSRLKDRHRVQILVKGASRMDLNRAVRLALASVVPPGDVRIDVDVDPQSLMETGGNRRPPPGAQPGDSGRADSVG